MDILGADEAWEKFTSVIESLVEQNATLRLRRIPKKPVWMTSEVTRAIRKKRRLWKRAEVWARGDGQIQGGQKGSKK